MPHVFTYGSLMCPDIMERVSGVRPQSRPATLPEYQRSCLKNLEYPGIVPNPQAGVEGILYLDVPGSALRRLDDFEGDQYRRQEVTVTQDDGGQVTATAYVLEIACQSLLTGEPWDFSNFLAFGKARFLANYGGFLKIPKEP